MIYITGDTHIPIDIHKLSTTNFPKQKQMNKSDFVIICGDFGGVWNRSKEEIYWLQWLNDRNFTTLFVDGNHENFNLLNSYQVGHFYGGKVHRILATVYHLMRGQVFDFNGIKIFTMGGAKSTDRYNRIDGKSWWEEEMPSYKEYDEALRNLEKNNYEIDYILTHTAPQEVIKTFTYTEDNQLVKFFDNINSYVKFKHWYFGHFHRDQQIDDKHTVLYQKVIRLI
jgi:DNA repair exonuclease SbcCD nuclease subunit